MGISTFVLASASRLDACCKRWIEPVVCVSDFDESQIQNPESLVQTLAQRKAETVAAQFESALILGCDSLLLVNGEIYVQTPRVSDRTLAKDERSSRRSLYRSCLDLSHRRTLIRCQVTRVYLPK